MNDDLTAPGLRVVSSRAVQRALAGRINEVVDLVEAVYRLHESGSSVNPHSLFLRFPDRPNARIIALPAAVGGNVDKAGLKWVSSFPDNVAAGIPRASAVLILNDRETGYPYACLEGSVISATRTAASAAIGAVRLGAARPVRGRVGFFGTGLIARYIHRYLAGLGWPIEEIGLYDADGARAEEFRRRLGETEGVPGVRIHAGPESLVRESDLLVFATTAGTPHVTEPRWFDHGPVVLHVSLRDLSPEIVLGAVNVVDDIDHAVRADTSLHLAEQLSGDRGFVHATLGAVLNGTFRPPATGTVIFSPFGLGVLDVALGDFVLREAGTGPGVTAVEDFFAGVGEDAP